MIKSIACMSAIFVLCLSMVTIAFGQNRQMYSWTDENGVVHFTDSKPEGKEVRVIDIPDTPEPVVNPSEQAPDQTTENSAAQQRRDDIARRRQENQEIAAENEAKCTAMRAEIDRLEPNRRVFFTNEQGETERMDDVERTDRVAELKALIQQYCD